MLLDGLDPQPRRSPGVRVCGPAGGGRFERSWERFAELIAGVSDPALGPRTHAELEEYLLGQGGR